MRLKYRILWLDDKIDELVVDGYIDEVRAHLVSMCFEPEIVECGTEEEFRGFMDSSYDLIISDYNLAEEDNNGGLCFGHQIVELLRNSRIMTEVFIYSSGGDDISLLHEKLMTVNRVTKHVGKKTLVSGITNLVNLTLTKFNEVNSVRGLAMGETSEMDRLMVILAKRLLTSDIDEQVREKLHNKIVEKAKIINKKREEDIKLLDELIKNKLHINILEFHFDTDKRTRVIDNIINSFKFSSTLGDTSFAKSYMENVQKKRNILGHVAEEKREDGTIVLKSHFNNDEYIIDDMFIRSLREHIIQHKNYIQELELHLFPPPAGG